MANETRGILFETIVEEALERARQSARIQGAVHWNKRPAGMTVEPDFTVGVDADRPSHVILVTASGAEHNSHMKAWRNLGEMQEVKVQLPDSPTVVNLYFMGVQKEGLDHVIQNLYDATLRIDEKPYYMAIKDWVNSNLRSTAKSRAEKRDLLKREIRANTQLEKAVTELSQDLVKAMAGRNKDLEQLWSLMRQDFLSAGQAPPSRFTSVRRGLAQLYVMPEPVRELIYANPDTAIRDPLPRYVFDLEFFTKSILGAQVNPEIRHVVKLLGSETCRRVLRKAPNSMDIWAEPLRNLHRVKTHTRFIQDRYKEVTDPAQLRILLLNCFRDPAGLSGEPNDTKVWVFETMVSLIKAKAGKRQAYGLAELARDTGVVAFGQGGFLIPPFVQRQKMLSDQHLAALAEGLARRFKQDVPLEDINALTTSLMETVRKENLEDRLIPYRNFEPLLWLLYDALDQAEISYTPKTPFAGWVGEYGGAEGTTATTPFVQVKDTLIHWKTVSDAGKFHKKKELAARARSVRYQYNERNGKFTRRSGVKHLALIVDGTFDDNDLEVLTKAGWDIIIYPDEISDLVKRLR